MQRRKYFEKINLTWVAACVLSGFGAAALYSQHVAAKLDIHATSVANNAAPSIAALASARADALDLTHMGWKLLLHMEPVAPDGFTSAMARLHRHLAMYRLNDFYEGEEALYEDVADALENLDNSMRHAESPQAHTPNAVQNILECARRLDGCLMALVQFNAAQQHRLAQLIVLQRKRAAYTLAILYTLIAIAGGGLLALAEASRRRYLALLCARAALAEENARLLERAKSAVGARDELLAIVSHDLRSPLASIRVNAQVACKALAAGNMARLEKALKRLDPTLARLDSMAATLVDAARLDQGKLVPVLEPCAVISLFDELGQIFSGTATLADVALSVEVPETCRLAVVACESSLIVRAISNLVGNALKFTPAGGRVRILAQDAENAVMVSVEDTGPGIAPENFGHIFERRWQSTADRRGIGLGLYIAQGYVRAHGSEITVRSTLSEGTVFSFFLEKQSAQRQPSLHSQLDGVDSVRSE